MNLYPGSTPGRRCDHAEGDVSDCPIHLSEIAALRARCSQLELDCKQLNIRAAAANSAYELEHKRAPLLKDLVQELADQGCDYDDGCPANQGTRHGRCLGCKARKALEGS